MDTSPAPSLILLFESLSAYASFVLSCLLNTLIGTNCPSARNVATSAVISPLALGELG